MNTDLKVRGYVLTCTDLKVRGYELQV